MAKTKRIFISDIHLSLREEDTGYPAWYKPAEHDPRLLGFLDKYVLKNADKVKDVVLLGDILNTWMYPANLEPPTFGRILEENKVVVDKLNEITQNNIALYYINGNHDFDLKQAEIVCFIPDIRVIRYYRSGRIHAEHGNQYDLFNKSDYRTDPAFGRSIGYFISRLVASAGGDEYALHDVIGYVDDLIEAATTSQNIYSSIIEGLAERAGLRNYSRIKMPGGRDLTVGEVKERYSRLDEVYSIGELLSNLYQRRYLNGPADHLCKRLDLNVVIFGHTHKAMIDKDFFLVDDRIYANTGSWCKQNAYCVEVDKDRNPTHPTSVYLHKIDSKGRIEDTKKEKV